MRGRQCKYVNIFVYSFHLSPFSSWPFFFFFLFANEKTLHHHMWSLLYQAEVHLGPSAGASILNNATQKALGIFAATFDIME